MTIFLNPLPAVLPDQAWNFNTGGAARCQAKPAVGLPHGRYPCCASILSPNKKRIISGKRRAQWLSLCTPSGSSR